MYKRELNFGRLLAQPSLLLFVQMRSEFVVNHLMIAVEPSMFPSRKHRYVHQSSVDKAECDGLEGEEFSELRLTVFMDHNHILGTNAILSCAIHGRFVTHHHSRFENDRILFHADTLRTFVYI